MTIDDILTPESVRVDHAARDKTQVIAALAAEFSRMTHLSSSVIADAFLARERLGSTGLGDGIAIPHARIGGLAKPIAFAIRLRRPVDFDAVDDRPVDVVVGLLLPESTDAANLACLAHVTRRLRDREIVGRIRAASGGVGIHQALSGRDG
jgi:nitrogen PTS system EIIA component